MNDTGTTFGPTQSTPSVDVERNLSVIIFLCVVAAFLLCLLLGVLYLNRVACFKKCDGKTCFDMKAMLQKAQHELFTDSSSSDEEEEERKPISNKDKTKDKDKDQSKDKDKDKDPTATTSSRDPENLP